MKIENFDFDLPEKFIAQEPPAVRGNSRLMVLSDGKISDRNFCDMEELVLPGDCIVINTTKVIPARVIARKETGGKVDLLFLKKVSLDGAGQKWAVLSRKDLSGRELVFSDGINARVIEKTPAGEFVLEFEPGINVENLLESIGRTPLPPYIRRKNASPGVRKNDSERYQTVYAKSNGSAAAPTAGLHFTTYLMDRLKKKGVVFVEITLHIGRDTFRPVRCDDVKEHRMHGEKFDISVQAAETINRLRSAGGRVFAVGTSVVRALETSSDADGAVIPSCADSELFIYPGWRFKVVDAMITNFHLPRSTPYLMVCALAGLERIKCAYEEAKRLGYRFYSYGDAMLINEKNGHT